jgi:hypothetical protein
MLLRSFIGVLCLSLAVLALLNIDPLEIYFYSLIPAPFVLIAFLLRFLISVLLLVGLFYLIKPFRSYFKAYSRFASYALVFIAITLPLVLVPPDALYLRIYDYATAVNAAQFEQTIGQQEADKFQLKGQKKLICFFSPNCRYCQLAAKKLTIVAKRHHIPAEQILHLFFGKEESLSPFYAREGIAEVPHHIIPPTDFLDITRGKMPVIVLVEDGAIKDKFRYRSLDEAQVARFFEP